MKKEFKNTDDLFQSAFADESAEVPTFVKVNIDKRIKQKGRRGFFFFGLIAVIALPVVMFLMPDDNAAGEWHTNDVSLNTTLDQQSAGEIETATTNQTATTYETVTTNQTATTSQTVTTHQHNGQYEPADAVHTSNVNTAQPFNSDYTATPSTRVSQNSNMAPNTAHDLTDAKQTSVNSQATLANDLSSTKQPLADTISENVPGDQAETGTNPANESTGLNATDENKEISNNEENSYTEAKNESDTARTNEFVANEASDTTVANDEEPVHVAGSEEIEPGEKYNPWMLGLGGGVNISRSNYVSPVQSEQTLYTESTNDAPGSSFTLDAKYRLNNSLTFGSGIGLARMIENYYFYKSTIDIDTTVTWSYFFDSLDTSGITPIDSTASYKYDTTTTVNYDETGSTVASYLHIPVSIGTQIIRNKFRFDFYVMARFNYLLSAGGGYVSNDSFVSFSKNDAIFKRWYVDLLLGTAVHYNLTGGLYISGHLSYRPAVGQLYQNTTFNRTLQYTHLGVGLGWKF